jgi:Flp pilus assembly protein TadG
MMSIIRHFKRDRSGVAAIEFALVVPMLMVLTMGLIDFSMYIGTRIELEQALRAGGQFALQDHTDTTTITSAVQGATNLSSVSVTVGGLACECTGGVTATCKGSNNYALCSDGSAPAAYITLSGSTTYDPIFLALATFTSNMSVQQDLTMRIR